MELTGGFQYQPIVKKFAGDNNVQLEKLLTAKDQEYTRNLEQEIQTQNFIKSNKPLGLAGENDYYNAQVKAFDNHANEIAKAGDLENMGYAAKRTAMQFNEALNPIIANKKAYTEFAADLEKKVAEGKIDKSVADYRLETERNKYKLAVNPTTGKVNSFSPSAGADRPDIDKKANDFLNNYQKDGSGNFIITQQGGFDVMQTTNGEYIRADEVERGLLSLFNNDPLYRDYAREQLSVKGYKNPTNFLREAGSKDNLLKQLVGHKSVDLSQVSGKQKAAMLASEAKALSDGKALITKLTGKNVDGMTGEELSAFVAKNPQLMETYYTKGIIEPYVNKGSFQKYSVSANMDSTRLKDYLENGPATTEGIAAPLVSFTDIANNNDDVLDSETSASKSLKNIAEGTGFGTSLSTFAGLTSRPLTQKSVTEQPIGERGALGTGVAHIPLPLTDPQVTTKFKNLVTDLETQSKNEKAFKNTTQQEFAQSYVQMLKAFPLEKWPGRNNKDATTDQYLEFIDEKMKGVKDKMRNVPNKIITPSQETLAGIQDQYWGSVRGNDEDGKTVTKGIAKSGLTSADIIINGKQMDYNQFVEQFGTLDKFANGATVVGYTTPTSKNGGYINVQHTDDEGKVTKVLVRPNNESNSYFYSAGKIGSMMQSPAARQEEVVFTERMQDFVFGKKVGDDKGKIEIKAVPQYTKPGTAEVTESPYDMENSQYSNTILKRKVGNEWVPITNDELAKLEQMYVDGAVTIDVENSDKTRSGKTVKSRQTAKVETGT